MKGHIKVFFFFMLGLGYVMNVVAQKPDIDTTIFGKWPNLLGSAIISNDGKYVSYTIYNQPLQSQTLVIQSIDSGWRRTFAGSTGGVFTEKSNQIIFTIPGDSLCILSLIGGETYIPHVIRWELAGFWPVQWLAYLSNDANRRLTIIDLASGRQQNYDSVTDFAFSQSGNSLVLQTSKGAVNRKTYTLEWVNMTDGLATRLWTGAEVAYNLTLDTAGKQLAFNLDRDRIGEKSTELWHYLYGADSAKLFVNNLNQEIESNLIISKEPLQFSKDGTRVFFKLIEKNLPDANPEGVKVDVWAYKDAKLQSTQLAEFGLRTYAAVVNLSTGRLIRLQQEDEILAGDNAGTNENACFVAFLKGREDEYWWNPLARSVYYVLSTRDGTRRRLPDKLSDTRSVNFDFPASPDGRWLIYFDARQGAYFSYDCNSGLTRNITKKIPTDLTISGAGDLANTLPTPGLNKPASIRIGVADWLEKDSMILIYDEYDIWKVDPAGIKDPENITGGYGKSHHIQFRLPEGNTVVAKHFFINDGNKLLLRAFDTENKYSGLYQVDTGKLGDPELLTIGPWYFSAALVKARDANVWITSRMSATEPLNYYVSRDLRSFSQVTAIQPQKQYNWLTAELLHYKTLDGSPSDGILYKPENFDPGRRYPLIFYYYGKSSDELYEFKEPGVTSTGINIPWFVSQNYLVFVADIQYMMGSPGESVVNSVAAAAAYLSKLHFVDSHKMGINGQSWGGYETNYLVTHTHLFAAAAEMAGPTDFVSGYGAIRLGIKRGLGVSAQQMYELYNLRMGATLWQRPDLYIKNSPVFNADQVTTPLLMTHNLKDNNVAFEQGMEFYTGLRRLGKKVWLLQYDNGKHATAGEKDAMDYTIRLTQFFDYYLKDSPPPFWMTEGIPARWKGVKTGYELDLSGRQP